MPTNRAMFAEVVNAVRDHTALMLGTTISYSEDDWAAPTGLSGWTRSHVAAHLADGADAMFRVIKGLGDGRPPGCTTRQRRSTVPSSSAR